MTSKAPIWISIAAIGFFGVASTALGDAFDEAVARGILIADAVCGDCHATRPGMASPLPIAPPLYELAQRYPLDFLEEALGEGMVTGHENMPEIELDPFQIDDFLAYLEAIQSGY